MSESGNAINVAHFTQLISFVNGYGDKYEPTNTTISLTALQTTLTLSEEAMTEVNDTLAPWKNKVNEREDAYAGLQKLVTRVVNAFAASGADQNAINDAKAIKRKIDGARAKALPKDEPEEPVGEPNGTNGEPTIHSVSQRSYTQTVANFEELIAFLSSNSTFYDPNESELQITTLNTRAGQMKAANDAVIAAATPLSNARIHRNAVLYGEESSLVSLAKLVKLYVKALYGADSPQFKQISGLAFRSPSKGK